MIVQPIPQGQPTFGYKWRVKTMWLKGKLPKVKYDVSGRKLTKKNISNDHIVPHSKGGRTCDENLMLATKEFNQLRGDKSLNEFITAKGLAKYLSQFANTKVDDFDGDVYIKQIVNTIRKDGV